MESVDLKTVIAGVRPGGCVQPHLEGFAARVDLGRLHCFADSRLREVGGTSGAMAGFPQPRESNSFVRQSSLDFARHKCRCRLSSPTRATSFAEIREAGAAICFVSCPTRSRFAANAARSQKLSLHS